MCSLIGMDSSSETAGFIVYPDGLRKQWAEGGEAASTVQTVSLWRDLNKCSSTAVQTEINPEIDGTSITLERYTGCASGSEVAFYKVTDGGHTWPDGSQYLPMIIVGKTSRDLNASETMLTFFKNHPEP
jgi:polyhydroxybutyrate depolymerase